MKLKRGTVREDGKILWSSFFRNGKIQEYWVKSEKYDQLVESERKRSKKRYKENPKANLESCKRWYQINKEIKLKKCKEYRDSNQNLYNNNKKKRMEKNPLYKCSCGIRSLIGVCIRNGGFKKSTKTADILGCSFEQFKAHLESQFKLGMSWDN